MDEIVRFSPAEIICNDPVMVSGFDIEDLKNLSWKASLAKKKKKKGKNIIM